jgi:Glycosyltransferase like family 2
VTRLGVLIPCRDEAAVIERKLADLSRARWPESPGPPHRILVVDDHSGDGTAERARGSAQRFSSRTDVVLDVVENEVRPGKPGAVQTGIEALEGSVDLLVLTDADVALEPGSLEALARAFDADARLAMACGSQRFVRDLAEGVPPVDASGTFDRWTAIVRRIESRSGRLFSVHGQLLAWRTSLRLRPRPGIAADDLDLVLQIRARADEPRRVALVPGAVFLEVKPPEGPARRAQALRRARAYVQLVRSGGPPAADAISRAQWAFYRTVPLAAPFWTAALPIACTVLAALFLGPAPAVASFLLFALLLTSPPGWRWLKLASLIREAARLESEEPLPERWTVARR